jgi:hypothetical protein
MTDESKPLPVNPEFIKSMVMDLIRANRRDLAWNIIDHYFSTASNLIEYDTIGYLSLKSDKRDTYLKCAEYVYSLAKDFDQLYVARLNLIKAYNTMNMPEKALFYLEQNLQYNPDDFELNCLKSSNLSLMGQKDVAEKILLDMLEKYPENATKLKSAFSGKLLREGNLAEGILSFIGKFHPDKYFLDTKSKNKKWDGIIHPGQTLYVDAEGGYGDVIINIRFFERLKSYGMNPILVSNDSEYYRDINQVLIRNGFDVLTDKILIDEKNYWTPLMGLPGEMGLTEAQLWNGPYILPLRQEKNKLPENKKFKIGIKNSGNPYFAQDEYRKIPIELMVDALPENCELYFFDKKPCQYESSRLIDLSDRIKSWEDTLDLIDQMDCIVSSCTSIVHAAGAMGKRTFVMVPIAEYYIWTTSKRDGTSPWYGDNFYVSRQTKVRSWKEPLEEVSKLVEKLIEEHDKKL